MQIEKTSLKSTKMFFSLFSHSVFTVQKIDHRCSESDLICFQFHENENENENETQMSHGPLSIDLAGSKSGSPFKHLNWN